MVQSTFHKNAPSGNEDFVAKVQEMIRTRVTFIMHEDNNDAVFVCDGKSAFRVSGEIASPLIKFLQDFPNHLALV